MPFSDAEGKQEILAWIKQINPSSLLDVGAGSGTYSDLLRLHTSTEFFDAMEVWTPYIEKYNLEEKYDYVWNYDVRDVHKEDPMIFDSWDVVIFGDVIEHMTKDEAKRVILDFAHGDGTNNIIISFPILHLEQGPYEGNHFETHVDHWTYDEMVEFCRESGIPIKDSGKGDVLAWFWLGLDSTL